MQLEEAMRTQRAIRRLKEDPVPEETILALLDLAIRAPSGTNKQNWDFIVVRDRGIIAQFARLNRQAVWVADKFGYFRAAQGLSPKILEGFRHLTDNFEKIPVLIVPCHRGFIPPFPFLGTTSAFGSIYPAVQNLLLAARAANLGALLITLPLWNQWRAKQLLGLPWNVTPCCIVPLGFPEEAYAPNKRRPVQEVVHFDRYGNRPPRNE